MLERDLLLVDARNSFFEEGGARDGRWCPICVAASAGVGECGGGGRGRRGDVEDGWGSEGQEVVCPFLCHGLVS